MSLSRQEYLAAKYMSGPKADAILARSAVSSTAKKKKKKRKLNDAAVVSVGGGLSLVVDDNADMDWSGAVDRDGDEDDMGVVVEDRKASFKSHSLGKRRAIQDDPDLALAREPSPEDADEQPLIASITTDAAPPSAPAFTGGLQTASQLAAANASRLASEKAARAEARRLKREAEENGGEETVYRDSEGRRLDPKLVRAEEARKKREEMERKMERMEWGKGLVQREDRERRKREEERMRDAPVARYADDEALNEEQKEVMRWHDPAAGFLTTKKKPKDPTARSRPTYKGPPPPPNRFGIPPGYRWDGVDRSNGFERQLMQKANERSRKATEAYSWSAGDM